MAEQAPLLVVSPNTGEVLRLEDPSQLGAAKAQGYTLASPAEATKFMQEEKYGGTGGAIKAFGLAAGRAATFGATDVAARGLGMSAEDLKGYEEANPTASGLGTAAGVIAPLAIPGIGELTGVGQAARAGRAVTGAVEAGLGGAETTLGRIAKHAIASGAGLATEGAAYGMGHEVSEAALGDPNQTATSIMQHVGLSALLGGGLGAAFGAGMGALPSLVEKAGGSMEKLTDWLRDAYPDFVESMTGVPAEHTAAIVAARASTREEALAAVKGSLGPHGVEAPAEEAATAGDAADVLKPPKEWGAEVADNLQRVHEDTVEAAKYAAKKLRPAETQNLAVSIPDSHTVNLATNKAIQDIQLLTTQLGAEPGINQTGAYAALRRLLDKIPEDWLNYSDVEKYQLLNQLKQEIRPLAKFGKFASDTEREAVRRVRSFYGEFSDMLENPKTWGEVGAAQSRYNSAKAAYDQAEDQFLKDWGKRRGGEWRVNPRKAATILNKLDHPDMTFERESLQEFLTAAKNYHAAIDATAKVADMPFDKAALDSLTDKSANLLNGVRRSAAQQAQMAENAAIAAGKREAFEAAEAGQTETAREILKKLGESFGGEGLGAKMGMVGAVGDLVGAGGLLSLIHGHPVGAAAAFALRRLPAALRSATKVTSVVGHLSRLEELNMASNGALQKAADMVVKGGKRVGAVGRGEVLAGMAKNEDVERGYYDAMAKRVNHLADPQVMMDHLHDSTKDLAPHAPQTTAAVQQKVAAAVQHLSTKLPQRSTMAMLDRPRPASLKEKSAFLQAAEAIAHPDSLLKKAANGTLTKAHVDAVAAVHPERLASMRQAVIESLTKHGNDVPLKHRPGLSILMGQPMERARNPQSLQTTAGMYRTASMGSPQAPNPTASKASKLTVATRYAMNQRQEKA